MKIVFAGTPEFSVRPLEELIEGGFEIVCVVTQEDKPQGRKGVLTPPPVKAFALQKGIPVIQPKKIRDEIELLSSFGGEAMITCAYGQLLTQAVLDLFPKGVWNIHAGLLPEYRGASPIQSAVLNGERETGVCVMQTELGLDSGDVLAVEKTQIGEEETSGELSVRLSEIGAKMIRSLIPVIESGDYTLQKQREEGVNIYKKISKDRAKIDFSQSAQTIVNLVRAMNPEPVAFTAAGELRINVFKAKALPPERYAQICEEAGRAFACGEVVYDVPKKGFIVACSGGAVEFCEVQVAGGKRMSGKDFLNGRKVQKGQVLSC